MRVGVLTLYLEVTDSNSLKDKRMVLKGLKERWFPPGNEVDPGKTSTVSQESLRTFSRTNRSYSGCDIQATINIGDRQKGRVKAASIIDCNPEENSIREAFNKLYSEDFQKIIQKVENLYGDGKSASQIKHILKHYDLKDILKKDFYTIPQSKTNI